MSFAIYDSSIIKIDLRMNIHDQEAFNVFYFMCNLNSVIAPASSTKCLDGFKDAYTDEYVPRLSVNLYFFDARLTVMDGIDFPFEIDVYNFTGSGLGQAAPSFNALGMTYVTGKRSPRAGGKRIPGVPEDQMASNVFAGAYTASWQSLADSWVGGFPALNDLNDVVGSFTPIVVSSKEWVDGHPTIFSDVQSINVSPYVTSQVSRKRGAGI